MTSQHFGYWIDLKGISFDDGTWLQAFPLGHYEHPVFGQISITPERVQRFAANVQMKVRGQDLDIDYDHKADTRVAAGWVSDAQARPDGLWIKVAWTPTARQKLEDGEYRYFSPEFVDEWVHPKTGLLFKDVLFGGALTNRPFLKDILPINLSEMVGDITMHGNGTGAGGAPPTDAENMVGLAKALGLTGQVTSADILQAVTTKLSEGQPQFQGAPAVQPQVQAPQNFTLNVPAPQQAPAVPQVVQLGDQQYSLVPVQQQAPAVQHQAPAAQQQAPNLGSLLTPIKLSAEIASDPVALADVVRQQNEKIGILASAHKLAEAEALVMTAGDGQTALAPAVRDLAIELWVKAPAQLSETVEKFIRAVAEGRATVALGEMGRSRTGDGGGAVKQFTDAVSKLRAGEDKMSYAEAVDQVSRMEPKLASAYRAATMAGEEY